MMKFWLDHPAASCPVSFKRWVQFKISEWLYDWGNSFCYRARRLEHRALHPGEPDPWAEVPF